MTNQSQLPLRELSFDEAVCLSGGDCTLQYHLGRLAGAAVRELVEARDAIRDFGRGLRDGLSGM